MPLSKKEFPEREFWSRQIHFTAQDCETLYWLVKESGVSDGQKERLTNKLRGYFVSHETQQRSAKLLANRAKKYRRAALVERREGENGR